MLLSRYNAALVAVLAEGFRAPGAMMLTQGVVAKPAGKTILNMYAHGFNINIVFDFIIT